MHRDSPARPRRSIVTAVTARPHLLALCAALLGGCGKTPVLTDLRDPGGGVPDMRPVCAEDRGVEGGRQPARFDLAVPVAGGLGRLQTTVFGPSDGGNNLSAGGAPFPLVILSP